MNLQNHIMTNSYQEWTIKLKKIIYVDVDGTVSYNPQLPNFKDSHTDYEKAEPIPERIEYINSLFDEGHTIVYWTARGAVSKMDYTELTRKQLEGWGAKFTKLQVGNKPHFDMYICDKSWNSESFFHYKLGELP